jgi:hypothetical protein
MAGIFLPFLHLDTFRSIVAGLFTLSFMIVLCREALESCINLAISYDIPGLLALRLSQVIRNVFLRTRYGLSTMPRALSQYDLCFNLSTSSAIGCWGGTD